MTARRTPCVALTGQLGIQCGEHLDHRKGLAKAVLKTVQSQWCQEELKADRSAASQLVPYIQDERQNRCQLFVALARDESSRRCKMDALILIGNLTHAFQIAQRRGVRSVRPRSCSMKVSLHDEADSLAAAAITRRCSKVLSRY